MQFIPSHIPLFLLQTKGQTDQANQFISKKTKTMKNATLLLLLLLAFQTTSSAQAFEWAKGMIGSSSVDGKHLAVDAAGAIYSSGSFYETCDFDGLELTSNGSSDVFIQKLNNKGEQLWIKSFGGAGDNAVHGMATDENGNVYIVGYFRGDTDFDPNEGVQEIDAKGTDSYILKLDGAGNFLWVKTIGNGELVHIFDIALDQTGAIIVTGSFEETVDFDPGAGVFELSAEGTTDAYLMKLDPAGEFMWAGSMSSDSYLVGITLDVDVDNNIYTSGRYSGTVDFDPTDNVFELTAVDNSYLFIQKLDQDGQFVWTKSLNPKTPNIRLSIEVDLAGNVFLGGYFNYNVDFDPGEEVTELTCDGILDLFVLKLDTDGAFVWVKAIQGLGLIGIKDMIIDDLGNLFFTGFFEGTYDFDPGEEVFEKTSEVQNNFFVQKMDKDGQLDWVRTLGSAAGGASGKGIALGPKDEVYVTGLFTGQVDFDPGEKEFKMNSGGIFDGFVLKLSKNGTVATQNLSLPAASLFPNPNNGHFQIALPQNAISAKINILDALGKMVYQNQLNDAVNQVDLAHLSSGLYFLNMSLASGERYHAKLMLQK